MIKNNQQRLNRLQVLVDACILVGAYLLAWNLRFRSGLFTQDAGRLSFQTYMSVLFLIVPFYLILYTRFQLYMPQRMKSRKREFWSIVKANMIGLMSLILILYLVKQGDFSRMMLGFFFGINIFAECFVRYAIRSMLRRIRKQGFNQKHIILIGYSRAAEQYLERIRSNPQWGYQVYGMLSDDTPPEEIRNVVQNLGSMDLLEEILEQNDLDEVVITLGMKDYGKLESLVDICEKAGIHIKFIPDYGNVIPTRPYVEDVQGLPVINIRRVPLSLPWNRLLKRVMDVTGALVALILFSPVMVGTALLLKGAGGGPVIFKQERVGLHNRTFCMYKFRSMVMQTETEEKEGWSVKDDPRITPIGRWIRKTSIDELPQLWNVLKGDMSLVGPRPERPQFVEKFKNEIPRYMVKHQVCPGLTGWAQVHGYRGDTSIEKRIEYDLYYIENWTVGLDFKILILTLFKGFINKK